MIAFCLLSLRATVSSTQASSKQPGPSALSTAFVKKFRGELSDRDAKPLEMYPGENVTSNAAKDELMLLAAEGLSKQGHTLSAQIIRTEIAGRSTKTPQGAWALFALDELAQDFELDESALEDFAYELDSSIEAPSERAMVSWYRAKALLRRGLADWALLEIGKVGIDTKWYADRLFEHATDVLSEGKVDEAEGLYGDILKRSAVRAPTRQFAELNRARLIFEKGEYQESLKIVRAIDLPLRERARALLEMAWSRYYLKDYGKALGILRVVDSAFFEALRSPESDVLQMVISRDLCRYDMVKNSARAFRERYKKPLRQIEMRLNLEGDPQLKQMALQSRYLQKRATLIHRYRTERRVIYDEDLKISPGLREVLLKALLARERKIEAEIALTLSRELDRVASQLIEFRDQVSFLEYEASMRPLTMSPSEESDYLPNAASKTHFEKLYWPVVNESWWDELDSYEVLIRARCAEPLPALGISKKKAIPKVKVQPDPGGDELDEDE